LSFVPMPPNCFLRNLHSPFVRGDKVFRSADGQRLYVWDGLHGHVEGFNSRGRHIGVFDAVSGELIGEAVKGRSIDV